MKTGGDWSHTTKAKEPLGLPTAGSDQEGASSRNFKGVGPCQDLDFGFLVSRAVSEQISIVLSHPACATLLWHP